MSDLQPAGVQLIAEGGDEFSGALNNASTATGAFDAATAAASGGVSIFGEIAVGALREIGSIAVDALGSAAQAAIGFFTDGFADAEKAEGTLARIDTILNATNDSSGLTSKRAQELAGQFGNLAGGSDDAVLSIEEMGLRMGTISSDEMPKFIQTTLDLAAATGTDATSAARLLAQAQDDPISALGRFNKMGIHVDDDLKAQIKTMVKAGDSAGAYALLMDRVGQATSGSAAAQSQTFSGLMAVLKQHFDDAAQSVMSALLPSLESLFNNVITPALPIITELGQGIGTALGVFASGDIVGGLESFGTAINTVIPGAANFFYELGARVETVIQFIQDNLPLAESTAQSVFSSIGTAVSSVSGFFTGVLLPAIAQVSGETQTSLPTAQQIFQTVMAVISTAIAGAAAFITNVLVPAATAAVAWFVANWPTIQATAQQVFSTVQSIIETVMPIIQNTIHTVLAAIAAFWDAHGAQVITILTGLWSAVQSNVSSAMTFFQTAITTVLNAIHTFWDTWGGTITGIVKNMGDAISTAFDLFASAFKGDWHKVGEDLHKIWQDNWDNLVLVVTNFISQMQNIDWGAIGSGIINGIAAGITGAAHFLADAATKAAQAALEAAKGFLGIKSPSTVAADEIGEPFIAGIVNAMHSGLGDIMNAGMTVAQAVIATPAAAMQSASINNSRSVSVPIGNVNLGNGMDVGALQGVIAQTVAGLI